MKPTVFTLLLTVAAYLLVGVHRMPAPITVPPEDRPATNAAAQEEPPKKATAKPSATPRNVRKPQPATKTAPTGSKSEKKLLPPMSGTWVGTGWTYNRRHRYNFIVTIPPDQKSFTVRGEMFTYFNGNQVAGVIGLSGPATPVDARTGNFLRVQGSSPALFEEVRLEADGTMTYKWHYWKDPELLGENYEAKLKRQ